MFIPALASEDGITMPVAWAATDGHASILFIVCLAVPAAAGLALPVVALVAVGALPWPGPDDYSRIEAMVTATRKALPVLGPLLFLGLLAAWMLCAAGLACAWTALKENGRMGRPPAVP